MGKGMDRAGKLAEVAQDSVDLTRCIASTTGYNVMSCSMCKYRRECPGYSDFIDYRREEGVPRVGAVNVEKIRRLVYRG